MTECADRLGWARTLLDLGTDMEAQELLKKLERTVGELQAYNQIGKVLTSTLDIREVLRLIMEKVGELQVGQPLVVIGGEEIRIREQACKKCRGVGKTVAVDGWSLERMRLREKVTARVVAKEMKVSPALRVSR